MMVKVPGNSTICDTFLTMSRPPYSKSIHSKSILFRIKPSGQVVENRFPGIAVPPVGENLMDMVPDFLRPQYEWNHARVLNQQPIRGLMHLARKGDRSLMWTACFKQAGEDGSIEGNCVDVRRMREAAVSGSDLDRACSYFEEHYDRPLRLGEVLERVEISRATLHRRFIASLSISALDYLTMLRVDHAIRLMRQRDPDLGTLALESGFCDQSYFGKRFKEFTQMTPARFLGHTDWAIE